MTTILQSNDKYHGKVYMRDFTVDPKTIDDADPKYLFNWTPDLNQARLIDPALAVFLKRQMTTSAKIIHSK